MKTAIAALVATVSLWAGMASAHPQEVTLTHDGHRQAVVEVSDLNLTNQAGLSVLGQRLHAAADRVCGPAPATPTDLGRAGAYRRCVERAFSDAVSSLGVREAAATSQGIRR